MDWAQGQGHPARQRPDRHPHLLGTLQGFRWRRRASVPAQPPEHLRKRVETYFDPLPFWYAPLEEQAPTPPSTRSTP
jgi:hypothetical protein